jgi:hypothetical protein
MKIMVLLHGTAIMHRNAFGRTRDERVQQVLEKDESIYDFASYIPVGNTVRKLQTWKEQRAEIVYLSSHKRVENVENDTRVLSAHGFPNGQIFFRKSGEEYNDGAERVLPDILIEDDCESIGGEEEMAYPHIKPELKTRIKSIVIKEFCGLDHLPNEVSALF